MTNLLFSTHSLLFHFNMLMLFVLFVVVALLTEEAQRQEKEWGSHRNTMRKSSYRPNEKNVAAEEEMGTKDV